MKKLIFAALVSFAVAPAIAQQRCTSGVYMLAGLTPNFYSVTVSGDSALIVSMGMLPVTGGITVNAPGIGTARPTTLQTWSYAMGQFDGAKYNVAGDTFYGACQWSGTVACNGDGGASVALTSATQSIAGQSWGVNCSALATGDTRQLMRVF